MTMADRIVVLRAGVVEQVGSPMDLYHRPKNQFVAGFIGSPRMNFLEGVVQELDPGGVVIRFSNGLVVATAARYASGTVGDTVTLGIRPEHLRMIDGNGLGAQVLTVEHLGSESYVHLQTDDGTSLTMRVNGDTEARPDQRVQLQFDLQHLHLFDRDGCSIS